VSLREELHPRLHSLVARVGELFPDPGEAMIALLTAAYQISLKYEDAPSFDVACQLVLATAPKEPLKTDEESA
jgi:hypothetical protein